MGSLVFDLAVWDLFIFLMILTLFVWYQLGFMIFRSGFFLGGFYLCVVAENFHIFCGFGDLSLTFYKSSRRKPLWRVLNLEWNAFAKQQLYWVEFSAGSWSVDCRVGIEYCYGVGGEGRNWNGMIEVVWLKGWESKLKGI